MVVVLVLAGVAVLGAVVALAMGRGGELAEPQPDHPPLPLGHPVTGPDAALLRLPQSLWGYRKDVTDEAVHRLAYALAERDARMALLERRLDDLRHRLGETEGLPGAFAPDTGAWTFGALDGLDTATAAALAAPAPVPLNEEPPATPHADAPVEPEAAHDSTGEALPENAIGATAAQPAAEPGHADAFGGAEGVPAGGNGATRVGGGGEQDDGDEAELFEDDPVGLPEPEPEETTDPVRTPRRPRPVGLVKERKDRP